eukprot:CFRG6658T1
MLTSMKDVYRPTDTPAIRPDKAVYSPDVMVWYWTYNVKLVLFLYLPTNNPEPKGGQAHLPKQRSWHKYTEDQVSGEPQTIQTKKNV